MAPTTTASGQEILIELVRRLRPGREIGALVNKFRSEIPAYNRLPDTVLSQGITGMVRQNAEAFFRCLVEGRVPTDEELEPFRRSTRERAAEGMPLEDLIHAYRLGGRVLWQALSDEATEEERAALPAAADLVMGYIDAVSAAVIQSYLAAGERPVSEDERRLRELLDALLSSDPVAAADRQLAESLGFPLREAYRPFAAAFRDGSARDAARLASALRKEGSLALTEAERVIGLAPPERGIPAESDKVVMALGDPTARPDLAAALDELRLLVDLSRTMDGPNRPTIEPFFVELLLARSPRLSAWLHRRVLGPLEDYADRRSSELLETLDALFAHELDRRRTAEVLQVHRNTLDYRLRRIAQLIELDLSRPGDLLLVELALRQRELEARRARSR